MECRDTQHDGIFVGARLLLTLAYNSQQ